MRAIQVALSAAGGVHEEDATGLVALDVAVDLGRIEAAGLLLDAGADPNRAPSANCGEPPLVAAILLNNHAMARLLLARGANANLRDHHDYMPIQRAIMSQDVGMVHLLLAHGAELHFDTGQRGDLVQQALSFSTDAIVVSLLRAGALHRPGERQLRDQLTHAIERRMPHAVETLVDMGSPFQQCSTTGKSCIQQACEAGSLTIALFLAGKGADVHQAGPGYDWMESAGSEEIRQWRVSLHEGSELDTETAPVGAASRSTRF